VQPERDVHSASRADHREHRRAVATAGGPATPPAAFPNPPPRPCRRLPIPRISPTVASTGFVAHADASRSSLSDNERWPAERTGDGQIQPAAPLLVLGWARNFARVSAETALFASDRPAAANTWGGGTR